jgi:hypothetical protein
MNAMLVPTIGTQRESDAQRRVDQAIAFAVWACKHGGYPSPAAIQERFGCSRRTASRWRKALVRGRQVASDERPPMSKPRASSAAIADELAKHAPMLALSTACVVASIRARYSCSEGAARRALRQALAQMKDQRIPVEHRHE